MTLLRRDYIEFDDHGTMNKMFCKMCGVQIAGQVPIPIESGFNPRMAWKWQRFGNYAEAKIQFDDGHYHVTNGCQTCINMALTSEELEELHSADMGLMPEADATPDATAEKVVSLDYSRVGLI